MKFTKLLILKMKFCLFLRIFLLVGGIFLANLLFSTTLQWVKISGKIFYCRYFYLEAQLFYKLQDNPLWKIFSRLEVNVEAKRFIIIKYQIFLMTSVYTPRGLQGHLRMGDLNLIFLGRVVVPASKIVKNLSWTYEKVPC